MSIRTPARPHGPDTGLTMLATNSRNTTAKTPNFRNPKTLSASWPVFHTGAFKFGNYIIRLGELYHLSDVPPGGAFIFCDEVHAF